MIIWSPILLCVSLFVCNVPGPEWNFLVRTALTPVPPPSQKRGWTKLGYYANVSTFNHFKIKCFKGEEAQLYLQASIDGLSF